MRVISIQSQVVYGHVGNSVAVFPMQAKGLDVAAVRTALFSNHPHYPSIRGGVLEPELVAELLRGIEERGLIDGGCFNLCSLEKRCGSSAFPSYLRKSRK